MRTSDRHHAQALDAADQLAHLRAEFHIPEHHRGADSIYLCGHSLGLQPRMAATLIEEELETWQRFGVEGHFTGQRPWVSYHERLTPGLATLTGAVPLEVVAMNSLTANLHLLLAGFYRPSSARSKILIEAAAFPSDRYAVASHLRWHGLEPAEHLIEFGNDNPQYCIDEDALCELLERDGASIALVLLPGVQYLSGQVLDCGRIATVARAQGCLIGLDLAHAIGNVPLSLHDWNIDFAVWCSYKYLNAGPGALGGAFVHERHAREFDRPRLAGWWGHDKQTRFEMPREFSPLPGAEGWQVSNPSILAAAPLLASLSVFQSVPFVALREKSLALTDYLLHLLREHIGERIDILTPHDAKQRGCQVSIRVKASRDIAKKLHDELNAAGCICDWREPDVIRIAPVPLYNRFVDVVAFVAALERILS